MPSDFTLKTMNALHKAVEFYLRRRAAGNYTSLEDFLLAFDNAWRNEGFLTREHEEQRKRAGVAALTRFYHEEEASGQKPTDVERNVASASTRAPCPARSASAPGSAATATATPT